MGPTFDAEFEARFAELYLTARRPARRVLASSADAEDVAAETLARLYLRWSKLSRSDYLRAWVVRVATNLAIDQLRHQNRPLHSDVPAPDELDNTVRHLEIVLAVGRLPRRQREVIALRYFADMPDAEIASALGMALPTVRTHLQRARRSLAARLGPDKGGLDDVV